MAEPIINVDQREPVFAGLKPAGDRWKHQVATFFDRLAPEWDARTVIDEAKINYILDAAGVKENTVVLDVACGTGVLFPYYLRRDVTQVIGVDISAGMARLAAKKVDDPRFMVICGDIEVLPVRRFCDCCVVYNAFPHFEDPPRLINRLAQWLKPGGRLAVAHSMGLEALRRHHTKGAAHVSREMLSTDKMAELLAPWFEVDTKIADQEKYLVSGKRKKEKPHF
ncbi:MAG: class I SAM-dependent methyltransferase [Firmicutes bacterium]|nr:class I SAM-dependent methyltransferase [Bacillota bacterium]